MCVYAHVHIHGRKLECQVCWLVSIYPLPGPIFCSALPSSMLQEADSVRLYHICDLASTGFRQWKFRKHQWKIRKLSREKLGHFFLALVPFLWQLLWLSVAEAPTQRLLSKAPVLTRLWLHYLYLLSSDSRGDASFTLSVFSRCPQVLCLFSSLSKTIHYI